MKAHLLATRGSGTATRADLIAWLRSRVRAKYAPQGMSMAVGYDCGTLGVAAGIEFNLVELQEAGKLFELLSRGYSQAPDGESYETALNEQLDELPDVGGQKPNIWNAEVGDILAFDFGRGVQHIAFVSGWDGRRFRVIHALQIYGVIEAPLDFVSLRHLKRAYRIRGIRGIE